MSIKKSMMALGSFDHHGHAAGIIDLVASMDQEQIESSWSSTSMALLSAERHLDALLAICREAEATNATLRDELATLKNTQQPLKGRALA